MFSKRASGIGSGLAFVLGLITWAAPSGAARDISMGPNPRNETPSVHTSVASGSIQESSHYRIPRTVFFNEVTGRGLLVKVWINGIGPYTFALDTGAGASIVSARVAAQAGLQVKQGSQNRIAGLSGTAHKEPTTEVTVTSLAIGDRDNTLPAMGTVLKADIFPHDIDGLLDPTEAFWPLGYVIDFPRRELSAFDPSFTPLRTWQGPGEGAVVPWVRDGNSRRPYVLLSNGDRALIDTGSAFSLAVIDPANANIRRTSNLDRAVRDVGGGTVSARRIAPQTVSIGSLILQRIPTDLVTGAERGTPTLLGRAALRPFRIKFDPVNRLIEIAPVAGPGER